MTTQVSEIALAQRLVRRYSDEVRNQPGDNSSQKMLREKTWEHIEEEHALEKAFSPPSESSSRQSSAALRIHYEELERALEEFRDSLPDELKSSLASKSRSWASLYEAIRTLKVQHDTKSSKGFLGQTKKRFHTVCDTVENHSNAFKMLPHGDKYTSIVCGSLEMITKASVNYVRIDEGFTSALAEINRIVGAIERELSLYGDSFLEELVVQLACKLVAFLSCSVKWYTQKGRKRFLISFNENLVPRYQNFVDEIRSISNMIHRGAQFCAAKSAKSLPGSVNEIREMVVYLMEVQEHNQKEQWRMNEGQWERFHKANEYWNSKMQDDSMKLLSNLSEQFQMLCNAGVGRPMKEILDREAIDFIDNVNHDERRRSRSPLDTALLGSVDSAPSVQEAKLPRQEIEEASKALDSFFEYSHWLDTSSEAHTFAEIEAIQALQSWTSIPESGLLGVLGPSSWSQSSSSQLIASHYVRAARSTGIPCISYFCELSDKVPSEGRLPETMELVAMLYGLIKQVILHLPRQVIVPATIHEDKFKSLDGTLKTWEIALSVFSDLLQCVEAPYLLCVIHGIEALEHEATTQRLLAFVSLLRAYTSAEPPLSPKIFKILFTTSGVSHAIGDSLDDEEIIDINRGSAADSPGRARKGRTNLSSFQFEDE